MKSKKNGKYTITKSETVYKNPWIKVTQDTVVRPNGENGIFGTIDMLAGSTVLPVDEDLNVYLSCEFQYALGKESLECMSGGMNKNETPLACAKRELAEELGISAKEWTALDYTDPFTSLIRSKDHMFLCRNLAFGTSANEATEKIILVKIPLDVALQKVMSGEITHATSCVLILKVAMLLQQKKL